ncbi:MAG: DUF3828 domain-containing protein [Sphingomonadaceae bacterium]|nr:DUF3828 domain-containing protein [Sphingomonadaceae bacterium]
MGRKMIVLAAALAASNLVGAALAAPAHRAAHARGVDDPRAFVLQRLQSYRTDNSRVPPDPVWAYSPRLAALSATYDRWQHRHHDEVGSIDFDWWINAQDWELSGISATQADTGPNARTVTAHWTNSGRADSTRFLFVRIGGRWYLDDVVNGSGHGDDGWTLSYLLGHPDQ